MSRRRVWNTLRRFKQEGTPKGELIIEDAFLRAAGLSREALLEELQADLITLPINSNPAPDWYYWTRRDYFTFALINGPFTTMINTLGYLQAFRWVVHHPELSRDFMYRQLEKLTSFIDKALDSGCDALLFADDLASQRGLLLAPEYLRLYYFPGIKACLDKYRREVPLIFHSDGDITSIVADLKQVGFWGVQGLQPDAGMDAKTLSSLMPAGMVIWGNFRFEGPLGLKTIQEVEKDAVRSVKEWQQWPYIFGSSAGLYAGLPLELVKTAYGAI